MVLQEVYYQKRKHPLTKKDKKRNQQIACERVVNENVIGTIQNNI